MYFLELQRRCGVSHEVRRVTLGDFHVVPGKSGLHVRGEGSPSFVWSQGRGIGPQDALKKDSRGLSQVAAGNPGFPGLVPVTSGSFCVCI